MKYHKCWDKSFVVEVQANQEVGKKEINQASRLCRALFPCYEVGVFSGRKSSVIAIFILVLDSKDCSENKTENSQEGTETGETSQDTVTISHRGEEDLMKTTAIDGNRWGKEDGLQKIKGQNQQYLSQIRQES